jgi:hypothetical protein
MVKWAKHLTGLAAFACMGCGPLTPPVVSNVPMTSGRALPEAAWQEMVLQVPTNTQGTVQRLAARSGEIFALVANQHVLRSTGGRFNEVLSFFEPFVRDFQVSSDGQAAFTTEGLTFSCTANCDRWSSFEDNGPYNALRVCSGPSQLGVVVQRQNGQVAVVERSEAGWTQWLSMRPLPVPALPKVNISSLEKGG